LDRLKPSERGDVLVAICRKIKAAANVVGPSPEAERGAARQQSALSGVRDGEQLQEHFFAIVNRIPELVDASYLRKCRLQIESALMEANGGAAFAESFAEGSKEKAAGFIKNGMKRYRLQLPAQVAPVILALANLMQKADSAQGELFKQTVCAVTPVELCGWILADALYNQNYQLLKASNVLGINTLALTSLRVPYLNKPFEAPFEALSSVLPVLI
jgi:hypothetical protein